MTTDTGNLPETSIALLQDPGLRPQEETPPARPG